MCVHEYMHMNLCMHVYMHVRYFANTEESCMQGDIYRYIDIVDIYIYMYNIYVDTYMKYRCFLFWQRKSTEQPRRVVKLFIDRTNRRPNIATRSRYLFPTMLRHMD